MDERVVRMSGWEVDRRFVHRRGHDRCIVNHTVVGEDQRAVVVIADGAWPRQAGRKGSIVVAWHHHPVWREVDEAGLDQERSVSANRAGPAGDHSKLGSVDLPLAGVCLLLMLQPTGA